MTLAKSECAFAMDVLWRRYDRPANTADDRRLRMGVGKTDRIRSYSAAIILTEKRKMPPQTSGPNQSCDQNIFAVVINDEEQYSVWSVNRPLPPGWYAVGVTGSKEHCLDHIEKTWTDMRPKSLRTSRERQ